MSAEPGELEAYVTATAKTIGLSIPVESIPLVAEHVGRLLAAGALVLDLALPDDLEPVAVFRA